MTLAREAWRPAGEFGEQPWMICPTKRTTSEIGLALVTPLARLKHDQVASAHWRRIE
jgi:hypothetical protein